MHDSGHKRVVNVNLTKQTIHFAEQILRWLQTDCRPVEFFFFVFCSGFHQFQSVRAISLDKCHAASTFISVPGVFRMWKKNSAVFCFFVCFWVVCFSLKARFGQCLAARIAY